MASDIYCFEGLFLSYIRTVFHLFASFNIFLQSWKPNQKDHPRFPLKASGFSAEAVDALMYLPCASAIDLVSQLAAVITVLSGMRVIDLTRIYSNKIKNVLLIRLEQGLHFC